MKYLALTGAVLALAGSASAANLLSNPGFETGTAFGNPDIGGAPSWITFGNVYNVSSPNPGITGPHSGTGALKQFGTFPGVSGAFQSFSASAGQSYLLSGFGLNSGADPMQADNFAILKIAFFNSANAEILGIESNRITIASTLDSWQALSASGVAPAGTVQVQFFALFVQPNFNGGSAFFDDIDASAVPTPGLALPLAAAGFLARRRRR